MLGRGQIFAFALSLIQDIVMICLYFCYRYTGSFSVMLPTLSFRGFCHITKSHVWTTALDVNQLWDSGWMDAGHWQTQMFEGQVLVVCCGASGCRKSWHAYSEERAFHWVLSTREHTLSCFIYQRGIQWQGNKYIEKWINKNKIEYYYYFFYV